MEETKKYQFHTIQQEEEEEENAKWVTHYSSYHRILLVGEGDFSFSLSLAKSFGSASNIVASSLNSYDDVIKMYKNAKSNLDDLHKLGACLLHGVDATKMKFHSDLKVRSFDRVIFNFPHAGFLGKEDNTSVIEMHRTLVYKFFKNASEMLRANGEIHVSHKITYPFNEWKIVNLALQCLLKLKECADFKREDYPGYNNKRGDGDRCDEPFPLGECCTFKFIINLEAKLLQNLMKRIQMEQLQSLQPCSISTDDGYYSQTPLSLGARNEDNLVYGGRSNCFQEELAGTTADRASYPFKYRKLSTSTNAGYPMRDHVRSMDTAPSSLGARNEGNFSNVYGGSSNYWQEEPDRTTALRARESASYSFDGVRSDFERHIGQLLWRRLSGQSDLHRMNTLM